jgi:hypothetical protein
VVAALKSRRLANCPHLQVGTLGHEHPCKDEAGRGGWTGRGCSCQTLHSAQHGHAAAASADCCLRSHPHARADG